METSLKIDANHEWGEGQRSWKRKEAVKNSVRWQCSEAMEWEIERGLKRGLQRK